MRRLSMVGLAAVMVLAACGDDDDGGDGPEPSVTTGSTLPPGDAVIDEFEVPESVECGDAPSTTVTITYAVTGAATQELLVDGATVPGTDAARGTVEAPVHCDELPHTFVLVATDDAGGVTTEERSLETVLP